MRKRKKQKNNRQRNWYLINAKGKILGRLATEVATILMGKNKPSYLSYLDLGDNVVVINAKDVRLSGRKEKQKTYTSYSGYPGGLKVKTFEEIKSARPQDLIYHAIQGMLPKNKLARQMIKKLYVYPGEEHPYKDKFKS
ncbi:50S ribosomal protein L13 [Candidatus Curtissbacteria bacterium RBG_16_39_7]|uniref:Large ribosomal subunit protein uL13 n=1 Tax=Candidatus Curtissbacteria bacterium RBG_16_39_7 TaxID=1797707 RepID=A0A1F5G1J9_9BACT|nr:MAG: 50S ribosomal protein L13 [Candidatus Curtissbacteria bacterium RBG_16_39_7]